MEIGDNLVLFSNEDESAMEFFVAPSKHRKEIIDMIKNHGGYVCEKLKKDIIVLVDLESSVDDIYENNQIFYDYKFVEDSVNAGTLQPLKDYQAVGNKNASPQTKKSPKKSPKSKGHEGGSTNPSPFFSKPSKDGHTTKQQTFQKGRTSYTDEEDKKILDYLKKRHNNGTPSNTIWKQMEAEKITTHTWQSMKERYRKRIAPSAGLPTNSTPIKRKTVDHDDEVEDIDSSDMEEPKKKQKINDEGDVDQVVVVGKNGKEEEEAQEDVTMRDTADNEFAVPTKEVVVHKEPKKNNKVQNAIIQKENELSSEEEEEGLTPQEADFLHDVQVQKCRLVVKNLSFEFKVHQNVAFHALIAHSGQVRYAQKYLAENGRKNNQTWFFEEDQILSSGTADQIQQLFRKRGKNSASERLKFLNSNL